MRFFSSVAVGKREVCGVETFDRHIFNIGPATREAPNLWIAYVMAGVAVIYTTRCYVQNDVFDIEQLVADMTAVPHSEGISVVGPPPLLLDLAKFLEARGGVALGDRALVLATGGWKRRQGEAVARGEFDRRVTAALGLAAIEQVRDTYNMVELNTVMFECAHKAKHCAPWVYASARDPRTLAELPSGQAGLLAFADPTPTSYPGFVLSDDFGTVQRRVQCACGIAGDTLTIERRVNKVETRGCALKLETVGSPT
jgi:long-chain-fatty-acid---luciferin-component ligase